MPAGRNGQSPDKTQRCTDKTTQIVSTHQCAGDGAEQQHAPWQAVQENGAEQDVTAGQRDLHRLPYRDGGRGTQPELAPIRGSKPGARSLAAAAAGRREKLNIHQIPNVNGTNSSERCHAFLRTHDERLS